MELENLKIEREAGGRRARGKRWPAWVKLLVFAGALALLGLVFRVRVADFVESLTVPTVKSERVIERNAAAVAAATGASANGYIVAKTRAALSADTPGRIVEMNVQEGAVVKKGFVVARLYSDEYAAGLHRAEADLGLVLAGKATADAQVVTAEKNLETLHANVAAATADISEFDASVKLAELSLERAKGLLANQIDTQDRVDRAQKDLDEARARVTSARARLEASKQAVAQGEAQIVVAHATVKEAEARIAVAKAARELAQATLDKTEVRAPFDGVVVLKDAEVGEVVSPNSQGGTSARGSVVTMVDFATLEVQAEVPETSLAAVQIGAAARIYLDAYPEKPYTGRVDRIWPTANRTKATVEVRITFTERDERLRPEMGVRVVFVDAGATAVREDPKLLVPVDAVVKKDGVSRVFVVEGNVVKLRTIKTGAERGGKVAVLDGLTSGDRIVIAPPPTLADGDRVHTDT